MARMKRLFSMVPQLEKHKIDVILIQIDEAHTTEWPRGNSDDVKSHKCIEDRISRAQHFINIYNPPYRVYVDGFENAYAELFHAWPDKYYCIDKDLKIIAKSAYHGKGEHEATIIVDVCDMLANMMQ